MMDVNRREPVNKDSGEMREVSKQQEQASEKGPRKPLITIAPEPPEREIPAEVALVSDKEMDTASEEEPTNDPPRSEPGDDADAELTIMLKQIETYFTTPGKGHDLEAISFSLRHLFSRVDFLYRQALPSLEQWTARVGKEKGRETFVHQHIWLHLQTINRTLDRMAPLCHLLSDVIECLLDTLDDEALWLRTFEEEETLLLQQVEPTKKLEAAHIPRLNKVVVESAPNDSESWERSVATLMDRLLIWQEQHHKLASFMQQFSQPMLSVATLNELDVAFAILLDSAGAIFGDILPNFRLVGPADKEEISALLFDLMQQSDQMLVQFEVTLEPLTSLLRHFAAASENN